jgi:hypothetical protein
VPESFGSSPCFDVLALFVVMSVNVSDDSAGVTVCADTEVTRPLASTVAVRLCVALPYVPAVTPLLASVVVIAVAPVPVTSPLSVMLWFAVRYVLVSTISAPVPPLVFTKPLPVRYVLVVMYCDGFTVTVPVVFVRPVLKVRADCFAFQVLALLMFASASVPVMLAKPPRASVPPVVWYELRSLVSATVPLLSGQLIERLAAGVGSPTVTLYEPPPT